MHAIVFFRAFRAFRVFRVFRDFRGQLLFLG